MIKMKKTRMLTEVAIGIAMAVVCSFIKVWEMPQGGSVSLTMIPLLIIAFRCGSLSGIIGGAIYGLLSMLIAGVIYHPMSILLDYVLAYGLLGFSGLFKKSTMGILIGTTVGVAFRFLSSLVSGAVLFAEYAPAGQNPWIYSLIYQASYMVPEFLISILALIFLYKKAPKVFVSTKN